MRLGSSGRIVDYDDIRWAEFDYTKLGVPEVEALIENEFRILRDKVREVDFPVLIGTRALPVAKPWSFTDSFSALEYKAYLEHTRYRAKLLGMDRIIIGSGKIRLLIDETSVKKENRFIDFTCIFAKITSDCDVEVILKPLNPMYFSYTDSLPEVIRIIRGVGVPNLFTMADLRRLIWVREPLTDIVSYSDYIHHIHMDHPISYPTRPFPSTNDSFNYTEFLDVLKEFGYQGTLTVEADTPEDRKHAYRDTTAILYAFL